MVEIVIENGDEGRTERQILLERARALHFEGNFCDAVGEENARAVGFVVPRGPFIADGRAVRLQYESAADAGGAGGIGRFEVGGSFGYPAAAGRSDFKILMADGLAVQHDGKFALVLRQDRRHGTRRAFLLTGDGERGREEKPRNHGVQNSKVFWIACQSPHRTLSLNLL